jgi:hypothetical protein
MYHIIAAKGTGGLLSERAFGQRISVTIPMGESIN